MIVQDEHTRKGVDAEMTVGDLCMEAMEDMMISNHDPQQFSILYKGSIYYFSVMCLGVKPPYQLAADADESEQWFGQRKS